MLPALIGLSAFAQTQFEVASAKVSADGPYGGRFSAAHGTLSARNVLLRLLIANAYGVVGFQIQGLPASFDNARFDIEAKAGSDATRAAMMPMLRALLEERFQLKAHRESREVSIFTLTVAKGGPKFTALKAGNCPPADPKGPPCGVIRPGANGMNRTMDAMGSTMETWTRVLTLLLERTVVDKTGLAGPFDAMHMEYAPEDVPDATGPSIFTAIQEDLGLKLEPGKGPVEMVVIDHIEKPTGN